MESKNPGFAVGDTVTGMFGVQEYAIADGKAVTKVDTKFAQLCC
jgi:NADPH-dependent curcumin reductase CurA